MRSSAAARFQRVYQPLSVLAGVLHAVLEGMESLSDMPSVYIAGCSGTRKRTNHYQPSTLSDSLFLIQYFST